MKSIISLVFVVANALFAALLLPASAEELKKEGVSQAVASSADSAATPVPKKISGRWKSLTTGHNQSFSAESISVSGDVFSAKFTSWISGGGNCSVRNKDVNGKIEAGVAVFSYTNPCFGETYVVLDFNKGEGTYTVGDNRGVYSW